MVLLSHRILTTVTDTAAIAAGSAICRVYSLLSTPQSVKSGGFLSSPVSL